MLASIWIRGQPPTDFLMALMIPVVRVGSMADSAETKSLVVTGPGYPNTYSCWPTSGRSGGARVSMGIVAGTETFGIAISLPGIGCPLTTILAGFLTVSE